MPYSLKFTLKEYAKMPKKAIPTDDEVTCFRESMDDVQPIRSDRVVHNLPKPPPHPVQTRKDEALVMEALLRSPYDIDDLQPGEAINYCRPGVQKTILRKLRKGQYRIGAEIDLHGLTASMAIDALTQFLRKMDHTQARCVRIIHGKGHRSGNQGPVLKPLVCNWLTRCDRVLAFSSARQIDGGTGALYVLLKRKQLFRGGDNSQ
jgi:DNA-nicking Smr family endonuclease